MLEMVLWVYLAFSLGALIWAAYKKYDLESLPSLFWFGLISLPFAVQFRTFAENGLAVQLFGIIFVGLCLLIGDLLKVRPRSVAAPVVAPNLSVFTDYKLYAVVFFSVALYHLSLLDHVPLWEKYVHHVDDEKLLQVMRERSSKLLQVPDLLKYTFNWIVNIAAPVTIYLLLTRKKYIGAFLFFAAAMLYAQMSLAKVPTFIMVACILALLLWTMTYKKRARLYLLSLFLLVPVCWDAGSFFASSPESVFKYEPPQKRVIALGLQADDPRIKLTFGDKSRLHPRKSDAQSHFLVGRYNYYIYRGFLGPVEISNRWYQFFPSVTGGYVGWEGLLPGSRNDHYVHPAQRVGNWAYTERFPEWYLTTVHAYASVDADAYARFGILGIVVVGLMILITRIALKWLLIDVPLVQALYVIGLVMLSLLLPVASLQAIFVANGLFLVLGLMLLCRGLYPGKRTS
ncbi:MAG: hypothetical protein ACYC05_00310 [Sulfuricella sp.]